MNGKLKLPDGVPGRVISAGHVTGVPHLADAVDVAEHAKAVGNELTDLRRQKVRLRAGRQTHARVVSAEGESGLDRRCWWRSSTACSVRDSEAATVRIGGRRGETRAAVGPMSAKRGVVREAEVDGTTRIGRIRDHANRVEGEGIGRA